MSRIYIAGPMTGLPDFNFPAFHAAAAAWRAMGWEVMNPAEAFHGAQDLAYREYVRHDIDVIRTCDAIALLDGWDGSNARGSVWEWAIATKILGIPALDAGLPVTPTDIAEERETLLAEANRIVNGPRQKDYGHPLDDFSKTAQMWGPIFADGIVTAEKVALAMICVKVSRLLNTPAHHDSQVDIAGYIQTYEMVIRERARRAA